jgi:hypothetical protein
MCSFLTDEPGVFHMSMSHLFKHIKEATDTNFHVSISSILINSEQVYDLLAKREKVHGVEWKFGDGYFVRGVQYSSVRSEVQAISVMQLAFERSQTLFPHLKSM